MNIKAVVFFLFFLILGVEGKIVAQQRAEPVVLCYHQVRDWKPGDGASAKDYIIPPQRFREHLRMLYNNGYHTILPDKLMEYLHAGKPLPPKTIIISFDDGTEGQFTYALPELNSFGFKAVFFIMTVTLDRPGYLSRQQVQTLARQGHTIGCHTWDHHKVTSYNRSDWEQQLIRPTKLLSSIIGDSIQYFAYPYGVWDAAAITQLKAAGYRAAFQLYGKRDSVNYQYSIRRIIASGRWNSKQLEQAILKLTDMNQREH